MKFSKKSFFFFSFWLLFCLPWLVIFFWPGQRAEFIACRVGQGDALLITQGFTQVLIDGGPNNQVLNCLAENMPFWDRQIEMVINTHPDADHITGLVEVLNRYQVETLISNSLEVDSLVFQDFKKKVWEKGISVYSPQKGDLLQAGELELKVLWPEEKIGDASLWQKEGSGEKVLGKKIESNQASIVLHWQKGDFDALLTGDITAKEEKQLIKDNQFQGIELLKVAHHGSKYSSCQEFLEAVRPQIAVISVGKNPWGHPTEEVLQRLQAVGSRIFRTDENKVKIRI